MSLNVQTLHRSLGAEIQGVDLSRTLEPKVKSEIEMAWKKFGVLVFRNQNISDEEHVSFSRNFGDLEVLPESNRTDNALPEIFILSNIDKNGDILPAESEAVVFNSLTWSWHTDSCYRTIPSKGAVLHGIEVVRGGGGETQFANLREALKEMPPSLRKKIHGLVSEHSWPWMRSHRNLPPMKPEEEAQVPPVHHKLIREHADGDQSLYISPLYMRKIVGLNEEDTHALVEELTKWATRDRYVYKHSWAQHDVVMWDNTWTMHMVMPYDSNVQRRIMHRTAIAGVERVK